MEDIEYERDGVRKFAQARFKEDLELAGWKVVEEEDKPKKRGRPAKTESES